MNAPHVFEDPVFSLSAGYFKYLTHNNEMFTVTCQIFGRAKKHVEL